jgi:hypothetical protein
MVGSQGFVQQKFIILITFCAATETFLQTLRRYLQQGKGEIQSIQNKPYSEVNKSTRAKFTFIF